MMDPVTYMLLGATALANLVASLFFLRFWKSSHDRFFLLFAASFLIEGLNRVCMGLAGNVNEDVPIHYLIRLVAYGLIAFAIVDKNLVYRPARPQATGELNS